ncbi:FUN14 family-domain-containing protein [Gilbertella persicaria]|nr:FUN14 family-domain-containing protein [Gilbertella persicaria]KAI8082588.1 FUN14 family-domain-containing protein [Gilbertella persicaria]
MDAIHQTKGQKSIFNRGELTFGTFLGLCTGFLVKKVGKLFAAFIGTGFVFLQYLSQQGYVTVHWDRLEGRYNSTFDTDKDGRVTRRDLSSKWQNFVNFLTSNIQFKSTFLVGFFAGLRYM